MKFYPPLEQLEDSNDPELIGRFDELLGALYSADRTRVAPSFVSRQLDVNLPKAEEIILRAAEAGLGELRYEIMCDSCGASKSVFTGYADIPFGSSAQCFACESEFHPSPADVWVTFVITAEPAKKAWPPARMLGGTQRQPT